MDESSQLQGREMLALQQRMSGRRYTREPGGFWPLYEKPTEHAALIAECPG